jgi:hypothetical protein
MVFQKILTDLDPTKQLFTQQNIMKPTFGAGPKCKHYPSYNMYSQNEL